jgi:hypothetical protein
LREGDRCTYCTEHPYEMKGVCVSCDGRIHDQNVVWFRLFGNYCLTCDLNAERKMPEIEPNFSLF